MYNCRVVTDQHNEDLLRSPNLTSEGDSDSVEDEREAWLNLSIQGLEEAYGEDEPEYSSDLIEVVNLHDAEVKSHSQHR